MRLNPDESVIFIFELDIFLDEKEYDYSYDAQGNKIEGESKISSLFFATAFSV